MPHEGFLFVKWVFHMFNQILDHSNAGDQKSDDLQYNTLGRWVDGLIDQVSDDPSIIWID